MPVPLPSSSSALSAEHGSERIAIHTGARPLLTHHAAPGKRPFIHPLIAPDGDGTLTEDAPPHHPWQHGLYVGLNDVDGIGFWTEGLTGDAADGTIHPRALAAPETIDGGVAWTVVSDWRRPDGSMLLTETQRWSAREVEGRHELDLAWTLAASAPVRFGAYAYGGLFVRMPFRDHGSVATSAGHRDCASAEAQRARWVAIAMPIPDRRARDRIAGLAILDHPQNPGHPAPWRVDAHFGIAPSRCIAGAWSLPAGESTTSRYRVVTHVGEGDPAVIEAVWERFSGT